MWINPLKLTYCFSVIFKQIPVRFLVLNSQAYLMNVILQYFKFYTIDTVCESKLCEKLKTSNMRMSIGKSALTSVSANVTFNGFCTDTINGFDLYCIKAQFFLFTWTANRFKPKISYSKLVWPYYIDILWLLSIRVTIFDRHSM